MKYPLIISYPKSGLNLVRIITEKFTNFNTPDQHTTVDGKNQYNYFKTKSELAFVRSHNLDKFGITPNFIKKESINKIILILRDYRYAYYLGNINNQVFGMGLNDYISNIKYFHNSILPKKVLYYEDLISSITPYLELFNFLELEHNYNGESWESINKEAIDIFLNTKKVYKSVNNSPKEYSNDINTKSLQLIKNTLSDIEIKLLDRYLI